MKNGIAVAGNMIVDNIKYIERYPGEQALTTITCAARSTGGLCCNCALTLSRLDGALPVRAIGIAGRDEAGDYICSRLAASPSINVSLVRRSGVTSYTDVMTDRETGRRTFFHFRGANALLNPAHFDFSQIKADILHIGYILLLDGLDAPDPDYPTALCRVLDAAQKAGIRTSVDAVSEEEGRFALRVPPALQYADYCVINETEASHTTGVPLRNSKNEPLAANLPAACQRLMDMGVGRWAVIHMPELSGGMERGGAYTAQVSWKIPDGFKKSSVGAGDAFASGLLYGAYHGWSLEESVRTAGAVAAYSLSGGGASDSIVALPDLMREMESYQ